MRKFLSFLAAFLLSTTAAWADYVPGPPAGPSPINKLTTADVFSDFRVSGLISTGPGQTVSHSIAPNTDTAALVLSSDGSHLYMATWNDPAYDNGVVLDINTSTWAIEHTHDFGAGSTVMNMSLQLSNDGQYLFVGCLDHKVYKLNSSDLTTVATSADLGDQARNLAISPDGTKIAVVGSSMNTASVLNTSNLADTTFSVAHQPLGVTFVNNTTIWVSYNGTDGVGQYAVTGGSEIQSVSTSSKVLQYIAHSGTKIVGTDTNDGELVFIETSGSPAVFNTVTVPGSLGLDVIVANGHAWCHNSDSGTRSLIKALFDGTDTLASFEVGTAGIGVGIAVDSGETVGYTALGDAPGTVYEKPFIGGLTATIPSGVAYVGGSRVAASAVTNHAFTASKDTYCFLQSGGTYLYSAVNNGAGQPSNTGLLTQKVVTNGTAITSVVGLAPVLPAVQTQVIHVTSDYTVTPGGNQLLIVQNNSADVTVTLPPAPSSLGTAVTIYASYLNGAHTVTVANVIGEGLSNVTNVLHSNGIMTLVPYTGDPDTVSWLGLGVLPNQLTAGDGIWAGSLAVGPGDISVRNAGNGLTIKAGSNAKVGTGTLSGGTATISNTSVTANSYIFVVPTSKNGNSGTLCVTTQTAGASFVVTSTNASDDNNFKYFVLETN